MTATKALNFVLRHSCFVIFLSCLNAHAGYTLFFSWTKPPNPTALRQCVAEMNKIIEARKNILVLPGDAPLGETNVSFNGLGKDAFEPFVFPGANGSNSCKTAFKPYDEPVMACLLVARDHFPPEVLTIKSDGSWQDWDRGARLYASVFGRPAKDPMTIIRPEPSHMTLKIVAALGVVVVAIATFFRVKRKS